ncbi:MAG: hypothetical protein U0556_07695 [Dehalococcoidia bacterium]
MSWAKVDPINAADLPVHESPTGSRRVHLNEGTDGFRLSLLTLPPGWVSPYAGNELEYHTFHEEAFALEGIHHFGHWRDFCSPGYLNHPAYWVHPSDEATDTGTRLLMKYGGPFDINYLPFPENWDGVEFIAPTGEATHDPRLRGVTGVDLDEVPWEPVFSQDMRPIQNFQAKTLYRNEVTGWTTWMMRLPEGWRGVGPRRSWPAGDELFVVEGDLTIDRGAGQVRLTAGGYYCNPDRYIEGGANDSSEGGCVAIRWSRGAEHLVLPSIKI